MQRRGYRQSTVRKAGAQSVRHHRAASTSRRLRAIERPLQHTIAVIADSRQRRSRFGRYAAEILRAEGLGQPHLLELSSLDEAQLQGCGVAILASCGAVDRLAETLTTYVEGGGRLILIRPPAELASLAGLEPLYRASPDARLLVSSASTPFGAFPYEPIQLLLPLDLYRVAAGADTTTHARSVHAPWSLDAYPIVVDRALGRGRVLSILYDLPQAVSLLRQGDPQLSETDTDGLVGIRPSDAQQWLIDPARALIPQAEVHQALLARAVEWLSPAPLPRLWHLPGDARSVLVLTGDLCSNRPDQWLLDEASAATKHGATLTYYLHAGTELDRETVTQLLEAGHSLSIHPYAIPFSVPHMDVTLARHLEVFNERFGRYSAPQPHTVRHHRLQWLGWAEQAQLEVRHGFAMDLNFTTARPVRNGYLFGAGRPLRFVDDGGAVLDCWQQPTHFEDDLILGDHEISLRIGTAEANSLYDQLLDDSLARWHSVLCVNLHPGNYAGYSKEWGDHVISSTTRKRVPVISAERWLRFVAARDSVRLAPPRQTPAAWTLALAAAPPDADLTLLVPQRFGDLALAGAGETITHYGWRYRPVNAREGGVDAVYRPA